MKNDEYFICSDKAAKHFAYQEMTEEFGVYESLARLKGSDLAGIPLKAPMSKYDRIYALPMRNISMDKGTGIVTSVPSDSPDDWAMLRDLQQKPNLREQYGIKEEWCIPFKPVPIIKTEEYGDMSAI